MKTLKRITLINILFITFSLFLTSCNKDAIDVVPKITIDLTGINNFDFGVIANGSVSSPKTYKVYGNNLQGKIRVQAPTNFELSIDNGAFTNEILFSLGNETDYKLVAIRFAPESGTPGVKTGEIIHSSYNAVDVTHTWTGTEE